MGIKNADIISNFELFVLIAIPCCLASDRIEDLVNLSTVYTNGILHIILVALCSVDSKKDLIACPTYQ